jgi:hypothetical protein
MIPTLKLPLTPRQAAFARWRVWAADVRDRRGRHRSADPDVAERAGLLTRLMDAWQEQVRLAARPASPANLTEPLEDGIARLVGWLVLAGTPPP